MEWKEAGTLIGFGVLSIWLDDLFWLFEQWIASHFKAHLSRLHLHRRRCGQEG